jgi:hypothetical protein
MRGIVATRELIRDAMSAVTGVTGYVYSPDAQRAGDAWGQWGGDEPVEGGRYATTFLRTYRVIVVLSADQRAADAWVDDHLEDIIDRLSLVLSISGYAYARVPADGSQAAYLALVITGESE